MSSSEKTKKKRNRDFWRACRFLGPYRRIVVISVLCAFLTGGIMTAGMGVLYPILQVMIKGDTLQGWITRQIAQHRLGVSFLDTPDRLQIARIETAGPADAAGLHIGDQLQIPAQSLQDPQPIAAAVQTTSGKTTSVSFRAMTFYEKLAMAAAQHLPINPVGAIAVMFAGVAGLGLIGNIFRFFQEYLSDKAAINAVNDIRKKLYDHVLHIPLEFFGLKGTTDVTSRLVQDCQALQEGLKILLGQSVLEPIRAFLAIICAVAIDWQLMVFILIFAPPMLIITRKFGKKMRRASRAALQTNSAMLGQIEGSLIGIRVVKAVNAERFERRRYVRIMDGLRRELLKMARYEALSTPVLETMSMWVAGSVLIFATYQVFISHTLTTAKFFWVMTWLLVIGESARRTGKVNSVMQRSSAAASRIFETLGVPIERPRELSATRWDRGQINVPPIQQEIRFENLTFSYPNTASPAVVDLDLVVPKGRSIAIVGRNGSGKTTLLAMLPRFYDPDSGRVTIDGMDIRKATLRSLRRQISIVTQDSVIFPGTIAENIAYGDSRPLEKIRDEIESAAHRAFAHDFIMEKPLGYDASLDGLGGQLSGGQKQRLNIARAILRKSPILILDEATSQVDAESEHLIQQAIESLMHERTTFVIAHRFSTILSADSIVVMERGRIVGQGKHEELLRTCETYQQLYERQMVGSSA